MPDSLQLYQNTARIQLENSVGDGGDDGSVLQIRTTGASFTRDIAGIQQRIDVFRTSEFFDIVHQAWEIEIRGNVRSGGFLRALLESIATTGTAERGLDVREIRPNYGDPRTFALQFDGIDGTTTFLGAALKRIAIDFRGRRKQSYSASFVALHRITTEAAWTVTAEEAGEILTTSQARCSLASDIAGNPAAAAKTAYEATIEIVWPDLTPAAFDADGIATGYAREGSWEVTGRLLLPETAGITNIALDQEYNGEINLRSGDGTAQTVLEIEAGITGTAERRTAISDGFKELQFDFVGRRGPSEPIVRFLTDQPTLVL